VWAISSKAKSSRSEKKTKRSQKNQTKGKRERLCFWATWDNAALEGKGLTQEKKEELHRTRNRKKRGGGGRGKFKAGANCSRGVAGGGVGVPLGGAAARKSAKSERRLGVRGKKKKKFEVLS